jgi:hypothetical protein
MTMSFFLGLLEEKYAYSTLPDMRKWDHDFVFSYSGDVLGQVKADSLMF